MEDVRDPIRLPSHEEYIAPVRVLDGRGDLVLVMPAEEFRRLHPTPSRSGAARMARRYSGARAERPRAA